jgi:hypothetical protein
MSEEFGFSFGSGAHICVQCGALIYVSDAAKEAHTKFHEAIATLITDARARDEYEAEMRERETP